MSDQGLFRIVGTQHQLAVTPPVYCRINSLQLISAPTPTLTRVVKFTVEYWHANPVPDNFATASLPLVHFSAPDQSVATEFSITLPVKEWSIQELEIYCTRHLLTEAGRSLVLDTFDKYYARLFETFTTGKRINIYTDDVIPFKVLTYGRHVAEYASDGETGLTLQTETASIGILNDTEFTLSVPYDADGLWFDIAVATMMDPILIYRRVATFK